MMSQFNSAVYGDVVVIISNIDRAISFAGTVDPLKGTASAEVTHNFRREHSLSLARDGFRCRGLGKL